MTLEQLDGPGAKDSYGGFKGRRISKVISDRVQNKRFLRSLYREVAAYRRRHKLIFSTSGAIFGINARSMHSLCTRTEQDPSRLGEVRIPVLLKYAYDIAWVKYCEQQGIDPFQYIERTDWDDCLKR